MFMDILHQWRMLVFGNRDRSLVLPFLESQSTSLSIHPATTSVTLTTAMPNFHHIVIRFRNPHDYTVKRDVGRQLIDDVVVELRRRRWHKRRGANLAIIGYVSCFWVEITRVLIDILLVSTHHSGGRLGTPQDMADHMTVRIYRDDTYLGAMHVYPST